MIVVVTKPFVGTVGGQAFNMPAPGTLFDVPDAVGYALLGMDVAAEYGMKVDPVPPEKKNAGLSGSSHLVRPLRLRTFKN